MLGGRSSRDALWGLTPGSLEQSWLVTHCAQANSNQCAPLHPVFLEGSGVVGGWRNLVLEQSPIFLLLENNHLGIMCSHLAPGMVL